MLIKTLTKLSHGMFYAAGILGGVILVLDIIMRHTWNIVIDALWLAALGCLLFGMHKLKQLTK